MRGTLRKEYYLEYFQFQIKKGSLTAQLSSSKSAQITTVAEATERNSEDSYSLVDREQCTEKSEAFAQKPMIDGNQ